MSGELLLKFNNRTGAMHPNPLPIQISPPASPRQSPRTAHLLLNTEISEEELAHLAEEVGQDASEETSAHASEQESTDASEEATADASEETPR